MDKRITIRFYEVGKVRPQGPSLREALEDIVARPIPERVAQLGQGHKARLERFEVDGAEFTGEFTRVQDTNYPSEVHDDGTKPLSVNKPLGHGVAFRYRPADHVLAVQYDVRVMSPGRIFDYIAHMRGDATFEAKPKMNPTNWQRMNARPLKKLCVSIASPATLGAVEDESLAVGESVRNLGDAYGAPYITIEIGMGGRKGALAEAAKQMAGQFFGMFQQEQADLRKLKAFSAADAGERTEEINLIDEILSTKDELELPDNDPGQNYIVRRNYLKTVLQAHV